MEEEFPNAISIIENKMKELDKVDSTGFIILSNGLSVPVLSNFDDLVEKVQAFSDIVNTDDDFFDKLNKSGFYIIEIENIHVNPFMIEALVKTPLRRHKRRNRTMP